MLPLEKVISCAQCGKQTQINQIRADSNGKDWICIKCYELQHKKAKRVPDFSFSRTAEPAQQKTPEFSISRTAQTSTIKPTSITPSKTNFRCLRCNYPFSVHPSNIPKVCPHCGREGTLTQVQSASSILKEVEDEYELYKRSKDNLNLSA